MKLNNKGFAISSIMYIILILAILLIISTLSILSARKLILDKIKNEVATNINKLSTVCTTNSNKSNAYDSGTEYKCQVNESTSYTFYLLSTTSDNVNLIMSENLENKISFSSIYRGENPYTPNNYGLVYDVLYYPPYILTTLNSLTSTWSNVPSLNENYTDKGGIYTISLTGKARLAKYSEIEVLCPTIYNNESNANLSNYDARGGCPTWLYGDYWTMDTVGNGVGAWAFNSTYNTLDDFDAVTNSSFGIRPVISIPKDRIEYDFDEEDSGDSGDSGDTGDTLLCMPSGTTKFDYGFTDEDGDGLLDVGEKLSFSGYDLDAQKTYFNESFYVIDYSSNTSVKILTEHNIDLADDGCFQIKQTASSKEYYYPDSSVGGKVDYLSTYSNYLSNMEVAHSDISLMTKEQSKKLGCFPDSSETCDSEYEFVTSKKYWLKEQYYIITTNSYIRNYDSYELAGYRPVITVDLSKWGIDVDYNEEPDVCKGSVTITPEVIDISVSVVETGGDYSYNISSSSAYFTSSGDITWNHNCSSIGVSISIDNGIINASANADDLINEGQTTDGSCEVWAESCGENVGSLTVGLGFG